MFELLFPPPLMVAVPRLKTGHDVRAELPYRPHRVPMPERAASVMVSGLVPASHSGGCGCSTALGTMFTGGIVK